MSSKSRSKKEDTPPPPPERTTSLPTDRQPPPLPPRSPDLKKTKEWEDEEDYENQRNSSKDTDQLIPEKKEEENRYGEEVAIDITVLNKFYFGIDFYLRIPIIYMKVVQIRDFFLSSKPWNEMCHLLLASIYEVNIIFGEILIYFSSVSTVPSVVKSKERKEDKRLKIK